jgi:hypothetical protein
MITSKIALLPGNVRQQVNRRLQAGETAVHLVEWINALPEAQAVFVAESSEPTVNEEDVSNWQQGGYRDWLDQQGALAEVQRVVAEAKELSQAADGALTDQLAIWTAGRYAIATRRLATESRNGAVDWNLLRALCHDLVDLRRGDHSAESLRIERERLEMERAEQKENLEKLFWEWAKENEAKICHRKELTPEEKERRVCQILGINYEETNRRIERMEADEIAAIEDSTNSYSI